MSDDLDALARWIEQERRASRDAMDRELHRPEPRTWRSIGYHEGATIAFALVVSKIAEIKKHGAT